MAVVLSSCSGAVLLLLLLLLLLLAVVGTDVKAEEMWRVARALAWAVVPLAVPNQLWYVAKRPKGGFVWQSCTAVGLQWYRW